MALIRKRKKEKARTNSERRSVKLVILTEKYSSGMREYIEQTGLNVNDIFNDVEQAKIKMIMEIEPCRLIIIESGLGAFTALKMREEVSDLIETCDGESKKVTVFYTTGIILSDNSSKYKHVEWKKYNGLIETLNEIANINEEFIGEFTGVEPEDNILEEPLKLQGMYVETALSDERLGVDKIDEYIELLASNSGESIRQFAVKY
jgi:hypothetical protein